MSDGEDGRFEFFGNYNGKADITAIVDKFDNVWFTEQDIALALGVNRTALTHIRTAYPEEFEEGIDTRMLTWEGRRRAVYSEDGFLTICSLSSSAEARRLRRWMRAQFRVRRERDQMVVRNKQTFMDGLEGMDESDAQLLELTKRVIDARRRLKILETQSEQTKLLLGDAKETLARHETEIRQIEAGLQLKPGEHTALTVAQMVGWYSEGGLPHNPAVILAAANRGYEAKGWMVRRSQQEAGGRIVEVTVFTPEGFMDFLQNIDSKYKLGESFSVVPNEIGARHGKATRNVRKLAPMMARAALPGGPSVPVPVPAPAFVGAKKPK